MPREPNQTFIAMARSLFEAFEAQRAGREAEAEELLEKASLDFDFAVEYAVDRENERQRNRAAYG